MGEDEGSIQMRELSMVADGAVTLRGGRCVTTVEDIEMLEYRPYRDTYKCEFWLTHNYPIYYIQTNAMVMMGKLLNIRKQQLFVLEHSSNL